MDILDPKFFFTFPFLSFDTKFSLNSRGNPSLTVIGD